MEELLNTSVGTFIHISEAEWATTSSITHTSRSRSGIPFYHRIVVALCLCLVTAVGFLGNSLVFTSVAFCKKLHTATNVLIVNLAIADFLTCVCLPFLVIGLVNRSGEYPLPDVVCIVTTGLLFSCSGAAIQTLAAISILRWYVITKGVRGRRGFNEPKKAIACSIFTWATSIIYVVVPVLFGVGKLGYSRFYSLCSVTDSNPLVHYFVLIQGSVIILTLIVTAVFYARILVFVVNHGRSFRSKFPVVDREIRSGTGGCGATKGHFNFNAALQEREVKITKNLFTIVCVFVVCFLPSGVNFAIPGASVLTLYGSMMMMANSALNPIIYGLKHPNFRDVFGKIIHCRLSDIPEPSRRLCFRFMKP
ncbi:somatostatin receptor type 5-like [Diadema setosum]|uniref:somatostatin receptor type 5-like n=1 Tax=Diadema setosum TaxID=31175 RepID=UPI003B39FC2C